MFILGIAVLVGVLSFLTQMAGVNYSLIFTAVNLISVLLPVLVFTALSSSSKHKILCLKMLAGKSVEASNKDRLAVLRTVRVFGNSAILFGIITVYIGVTATFQNADSLTLTHLRGSITLYLHMMVLPLYLKTFALLSEAWINTKFD